MKIPNKRMLTFIGLLLVLTTLSACVSGSSPTHTQSKVSTSMASKAQAPDDNDQYEEKTYSIFYDQGDHFEDLVMKGYYRKAATLYEDHKTSFFDKKSAFSGKKNKETHKPSMDIVAASLNAQYMKKISGFMANLDLYTSRIPEPEQWGHITEDVDHAMKLFSEYESCVFLKEGNYRLNEIDRLNKVVKKVLNELKDNSKNAFLSYDIFGGDDFFKKYPYSIPNENLLFKNAAKEIKQKIKAADCLMLERFNAVYGKYLNEELEDYIGNLFVEKDLAANMSDLGPIDLSCIANSLKKANEKGFRLAKYKGKTVSFVEVTSKTLLKEGYIEFPAEVDVNLPFEHRACELNDAFKDNTRSDFIVVFDVAQANIKRRVIKKENVKSKYLTGYKSVDNPNYRRISLEIAEAERGLISAQYQNCYSTNVWVQLACEIAKAAAVSASQQKVNAVKQAYINTSPTREEPIHEAYHFNLSDVDVTKLMTVNYYILDRINRKYYKSQFDVSEKKSFRLAYNIKDEDTNHTVFMNQYNSEDDIEKFEKSPVSVKLSSLVEDYTKNISKRQVLTSEDALREEMLLDKNRALAAYKEESYTTRPLNDPRFNNVVVIYGPGSLGTGFFIAPNLVLTNYHVVEDGKFFEMKLYNGMETFGKVVKSDVRLDLALLKVEARGEPVQFYTSNELDLGVEVEAIGHPKGLEFSITRGVVSALRHKNSVYDIGGKKILFVQTDAAVNPGNSGGPLFQKDKVVGVNNQKIVGNTVEGLAFAIHYSEVKQFLKESF
jgi:serine protease Do